jgi:hypothetical protein
MHFPSQKKERIYLKLDWKEIEKRKEKGIFPCYVNVLEMDLAVRTCTW